MARVKAGSSGRTRQAGFTWWHGLICGALLTFAPGQALLLCALLAPALASFVVDTGEARGTTRSVALACLAAAIAPVWRLWNAGNRLPVALALLGDPMVLGLAWGGGASAWALCQVAPAIIESVWKARETARARAIEAEMAQIKENWHLE